MTTKKLSPSQSLEEGLGGNTEKTSWLARVFPLTQETILIGLILLAAVFTRLYNLGARVMSHDESLHVYYSYLLSIGREYAHNPMMHGPSLFEFTALINRIFGANDFTSRLVPVILGLFVAVAAPQLLKPWLGRVGALVVSALFLVSPYVLYFSRYIRHDIQVLAWALLSIIAIFRYLDKRQEADLFLLTGGLAMMLSTMEISFFYLAVFALFFIGRIIFLFGPKWKKIFTSAEFDLLVVVVTFGAFFSSPIALFILNPIWTRLTGSPYIAVEVFDTQTFDWQHGDIGQRVWILFGIFAVLATAIGVWWGRLKWLALAALFAAITIPLYTTYFTNADGIGTGFVGSLGYWLSQHGVGRGTQPWYYYLIVFPIYEYLPLLGSFAAGIYYYLRREMLSSHERTFLPFVFVWAAGIFIGLTSAGEKMPWLSTHIAVPAILLAGWWIGRILVDTWGQRQEGSMVSRMPARLLLITAVGLLYLATARTSYLANYVNYDYTTEHIDYAHGAPGIKWALEDIESIAQQTGQGKNIKVAYDDEVSWPITWYMHDYPNQSYFGSQPSRQALDAPVVLAGSKNWPKVEALLGNRYHRYEVIRMWWPVEDYKNLTWERIRFALTDGEMRRALWHIFWNRDYSLYAELTNQTIDPPRTWPLSDRMRVYISKEAAAQVPGLALESFQIADLPEPVDAYRSVKRPMSPTEIVTPGLNGPRGLAVDSQGNVYVADTGNSQIMKLDPSGNILKVWGGRTPEGQVPPSPGMFMEPWGVAVDEQGNVYVADTWNHRIQKFTSDGTFLSEWGVGGIRAEGPDRFWGPRAVAVSPDGKVYVTDTGNKRVAAFDSSGSFLFDFETSPEAALEEPVGIAVGPDGQVFVADTWNTRVAVFSPEGAFVSSWPVQGWYSNSLDNKPFLTVDREGRVYLTDPEAYRVIAFSSSGSPLAVFGQYGPEPDSFGLPAGAAVSPDGKLWISDAANQRITQFQLWEP